MLVNITLKKGQILLNEGDPSDCLYFLKSGELAIYKFDQEHKRHNVIAHIEAGEMVGEMSFLDNLPRSASVKATVDSELAMMNREGFVTLLASQDKIIQNLVHTLSNRLRKANQKIKL
ncbi:MAG: Crp/Fnr family transcriptional regulator [Bacteriovoracaceae bacterium]